MGWGQIIGGGEDGSYTLALDYGAATRDAWIAAIDGWIDRMNVEIAAAEAAVVAAEARAAEAEAELQGLISALSGGGGNTPELMAKIDIATARYAQAAAARDAVRIPRDMRIAERKELVRKKNDLQSTVLQETKQAWCVDFTGDATGYVATIEIPGENQAVLIAPGGREPVAADGQLMARELMTPWQAFWNAAVLPGWQKWKPTYRKATITWLDSDANLANVTLDAATSSANQLPINQTPQLYGVPMRYMDCDASAFAVGDRVVVEFEGQSWQAPRIIGFVESPKPCSWVCVGSPENSFGDMGGLFGIYKYTQLVLECLIPGLVDSIISASGVEVFARFDGGSKTPVPPVVIYGETLSGLYSIQNNGGAEDSWIRLDLRFIPPSNSPFGIISSLPNGGLAFVPAHYAIGNNANTQSPGERWDVAEVIVKIDGKIRLNFAIEEMWEETHARIAGVPIKIPDGRFFTVSKLTDFLLQGA